MTGSASPSAFQITIEPSGRSFSVATGETILAAGITQGMIESLSETLDNQDLMEQLSIPPSDETLNWIERVLDPEGTAMAEDLGQRMTRLFLSPGMCHCQGGPGLDDFDSLIAIQRWVGRG